MCDPSWWSSDRVNNAVLRYHDANACFPNQKLRDVKERLKLQRTKLTRALSEQNINCLGVEGVGSA